MDRQHAAKTCVASRHSRLFRGEDPQGARCRETRKTAASAEPGFSRRRRDSRADRSCTNSQPDCEWRALCCATQRIFVLHVIVIG